eukprot:SAG31_NODE_549_length_14219_cov_5.808188_7_plen_235_part_00
MQKSINDYISSCQECNNNKINRGKPLGQMQKLQKPTAPGQIINMDFITDLPRSLFRGSYYDAIWTIVDRFSRRVYAHPCRMSMTAPSVSSLTAMDDDVFLSTAQIALSMKDAKSELIEVQKEIYEVPSAIFDQSKRDARMVHLRSRDRTLSQQLFTSQGKLIAALTGDSGDATVNAKVNAELEAIIAANQQLKRNQSQRRLPNKWPEGKNEKYDKSTHKSYCQWLTRLHPRLML